MSVRLELTPGEDPYYSEWWSVRLTDEIETHIFLGVVAKTRQPGGHWRYRAGLGGDWHSGFADREAAIEALIPAAIESERRDVDRMRRCAILGERRLECLRRFKAARD